MLLTIKNSSEKILHVVLADPTSDYRVVAMHKTELIEVTENLPELREDPKRTTGPTRNSVKALEPEETCEDAIEIRFRAENERTGEYGVQIERDLPPEFGKGIVESNTITVTVIN